MIDYFISYIYQTDCLKYFNFPCTIPLGHLSYMYVFCASRLREPLAPFQLNKMGPRDASQAVEIQRNLSKIFNDDDDDDDSDEDDYGGKSEFAREAEIVGPILLGGLLVFAAVIFCCTCQNNRGRSDNGTEIVLLRASFLSTGPISVTVTLR